MAGKGYMGKVMWVDLTRGTITREAVPDEVYRKFLSGYGLGAKILFDRIHPGIAPLGPENILGFCSGLLTGVGSVFTGRFEVVAKSPLTGGWGDANCGGDLSPAIKKAGVDAVFFTGISPKPVYLMVDGDKAELKDAAQVWGKDAVETEDAIRKELGDDKAKFKLATIGPAGEKLVLFAGISNDRGRYAARSGLGAVMGSKKLKALAIKGEAKLEGANPEAIKTLTREFQKSLKKADFMQKVLGSRVIKIAGIITRTAPLVTAQPGDLWCQILKKYGTSGITAMSAESGDSPVKNWGGAGHFDFPLSRASKIGDEEVVKYQVKKYGCYSCPISCGGICEVKEGPYPLGETHKPEYETLGAFGTLCLVDDLKAIYKLNDMCNRGGVDTISAGTVIAFAIECVENGILTKQEVGGLDLGWGKVEPMLKLLEMIIQRQGIGDVLAEGVKRAAAKIGKGSEKFAIHAGGQELPQHDPKLDPGYALAYEVEPTPGRHTISNYTYQDLMLIHRYSKTADKIKQIRTHKERLSPHGKSNNQALNTKLIQLANGAGVCEFGMCCGPKYPLYEYLNAATGWKLTEEDFLLIGERIETIRHAFNVREGITHQNTKMAGRARGLPPLERGPHKGVTLDVDTMAKEFYLQFGWDYETGKPGKERLEKLGLHEVIKEFYG
jgi:aldehyde:ferredoxin oxidoreductase